MAKDEIDEIDKAFEESPTKIPVTIKPPVVRPAVKPPVSHVGGVESFQSARKWIDEHILPAVAWVGLVGLGVVGADTILNHLSTSIRITASIFIVAFLAFKLP
jgi:hypothetical protein